MDILNNKAPLRPRNVSASNGSSFNVPSYSPKKKKIKEDVMNEMNEINEINEMNEINAYEKTTNNNTNDAKNMCEINNAEKKPLGEGAFSKVYSAKHLGKTYALKYLYVPEIYDKNEIFYYGDFDKSKYLNTNYVLNTEYFLTKYICSQLKNVILLLTDVFSFNAEFMISRGKEKRKNILLPYRGLFCIELLKAVDYMHRMDVMHLDLKPANILIKEFPPQIVVADLGGSIYNPLGDASANTFEWAITEKYSPLYVIQKTQEKKNNFSFTKKYDIWSCGLIMAEFMLNELFVKETYFGNFVGYLKNIYDDLKRLENKAIDIDHEEAEEFLQPILYLMNFMKDPIYFINIEKLPSAKEILENVEKYTDIESINKLYMYENYNINIDMFNDSFYYIYSMIMDTMYIIDMPLYLFFMIIHNLIRLLIYYKDDKLNYDELKILIKMCYKVYSFLDIPKLGLPDDEYSINLELKLLDDLDGYVTQKTVFDYIKNVDELEKIMLYIFEPNTYFEKLNNLILDIGDSEIDYKDKYNYTFKRFLSLETEFKNKIYEIRNTVIEIDNEGWQ